MRRAAGTLCAALLISTVVMTTTASADSTVIRVNQSRRIVLRGAAANVIVGDPAVADVSVIDAHSVILLGKGYGATDVLVMDRAGRTLLDDHVTVTAPESGVVTLHRGVNAVEYTCSPRCQALPPLRDGGGAGAPAMTGTPTNTPASAPSAP